MSVDFTNINDNVINDKSYIYKNVCNLPVSCVTGIHKLDRLDTFTITIDNIDLVCFIVKIPGSPSKLTIYNSVDCNELYSMNNLSGSIFYYESINGYYDNQYRDNYDLIFTKENNIYYTKQNKLNKLSISYINEENVFNFKHTEIEMIVSYESLCRQFYFININNVIVGYRLIVSLPNNGQNYVYSPISGHTYGQERHIFNVNVIDFENMTIKKTFNDCKYGQIVNGIVSIYQTLHTKMNIIFYNCITDMEMLEISSLMIENNIIYYPIILMTSKMVIVQEQIKQNNGNSPDKINSKIYLLMQEPLLDIDKCEVCKKRTERNYTLVPCGHTKYCDECAKDIKLCVICNTSTLMTMKIQK